MVWCINNTPDLAFSHSKDLDAHPGKCSFKWWEEVHAGLSNLWYSQWHHQLLNLSFQYYLFSRCEGGSWVPEFWERRRSKTGHHKDNWKHGCCCVPLESCLVAICPIICWDFQPKWVPFAPGSPYTTSCVALSRWWLYESFLCLIFHSDVIMNCVRIFQATLCNKLCTYPRKSTPFLLLFLWRMDVRR